MATILVVEDEPAIADLLCLNLNAAGYRTVQALDGRAGLSGLDNATVDLVMLDLMLPGSDGYVILKEAVKKKKPVIILSARDGLRDKVQCLNLGADDYITKPFEGVELIARVGSVLRRSAKATSTLALADIELSVARRTVSEAGADVPLTAKEFDLLHYLLENAGLTLTREQILEHVWGFDFPGGTRTVDMHVRRLRAKFRTLHIVTVFKVGYRLEA